MYLPIPIQGVTLTPIPRGAAFPYLFTLGIDVTLPDPNTWTDCRFTVVSLAPAGVTFTISQSSMTFTPSGHGPWTLDLAIPLSSSQTLSLPASSITPCRFQLDASASGWSDVLLEGQVFVYTPKKSFS